MADVSITNHHRHHRILMFSLIEREGERERIFFSDAINHNDEQKKRKKNRLFKISKQKKKLNETFSQILVDNFFSFFFILVQTNTEFFFFLFVCSLNPKMLYI